MDPIKFKFSCLQCGKCCWGPGTVELSPGQVLHIKTKQPCYFLKDNKCSIYKNRPEQCRTYPYWPRLQFSKQRLLEVMKYCKGIILDD